jgi:hypothetical protein
MARYKGPSNPYPNERVNLQIVLSDLHQHVALVEAVAFYDKLIAFLNNAAGSQNPSKTECKWLASHLFLLHGVIRGLGSSCAPHTTSINDLMLRVSHIEDHSVVSHAIEVLDALVISLATDSIARSAIATEQTAPGQSKGVPGSLRGAVARWVARDMAGSLPLKWEMCSSEDRRTAEAILESCLRDAKAEISAMMADGSIRDPGHSIRLRLVRVQSLLFVVTKHAGPFGHKSHLKEGAAGLLGSADENVDSIATCADIFQLGVDSKLREEALQAALTVVEHVDPENTWALHVAVPIIQVCP